MNKWNKNEFWESEEHGGGGEASCQELVGPARFGTTIANMSQMNTLT